VKTDEEMVGTVFFETEHGGFLSAFDDGTIGQVPPPEARDNEDGEPVNPNPEDLFSIVRVSDNRIAIKSAFGRYISCDDMGTVSARMEAMGSRELWQPLWRDKVRRTLFSNQAVFSAVLPLDVHSATLSARYTAVAVASHRLSTTRADYQMRLILHSTTAFHNHLPLCALTARMRA
jgi:hypothetical protein